MVIFVNYYRDGAAAIRGGSVYTAMMAQNLRSPNILPDLLTGVKVFDAAWKRTRVIQTQIDKYFTFPYRRLAAVSRGELIHLPSPFNPACLLHNRCVLTTFHDQVNYEFYQNKTKGQALLKSLEDLAAARTDYMITPSQFTAERTLARFPKFKGKLEVVYPGVGSVFFETRSQRQRDQIRQKLSLKPTDRFLLYVGAASPHKNHSRVVKAYSKLRQNYPNLKLIMIGKIRTRREFPNLVRLLSEKNLSIDTDIIIPRKSLSTIELSALYQSAAVFLFPSFYEGWGIVVGEAFASGTPTVISDIPVFKECFSGGALMVNPSSVEEIAEGVDAMLSQPAMRERYVKRGRELVQHRTWENTIAETIKVYRQFS